MSKKVRNIVTLKIPSCEASSKPPLGSTIGQFGVPIMDFCNLFNKITLDQDFKKGILVNCVLYIYHDFSFDLKVSNIDLGYLLKVSIKNQLLTGKKNLTTKKGRVQSLIYGVKKRKHRTRKKKLSFFFFSSLGLYEIAYTKYVNLNTSISFLSYYKSVYGTCRSMGFFIFPSIHLHNSNKIKDTFLLNLISNMPEKSKKKYLVGKTTYYSKFNKLAFN